MYSQSPITYWFEQTIKDTWGKIKKFGKLYSWYIWQYFDYVANVSRFYRYILKYSVFSDNIYLFQNVRNFLKSERGLSFSSAPSTQRVKEILLHNNTLRLKRKN